MLRFDPMKLDENEREGYRTMLHRDGAVGTRARWESIVGTVEGWQRAGMPDEEIVALCETLHISAVRAMIQQAIDSNRLPSVSR